MASSTSSPPTPAAALPASAPPEPAPLGLAAGPTVTPRPLEPAISPHVLVAATRRHPTSSVSTSPGPASEIASVTSSFPSSASPTRPSSPTATAAPAPAALVVSVTHSLSLPLGSEESVNPGHVGAEVLELGVEQVQRARYHLSLVRLSRSDFSHLHHWSKSGVESNNSWHGRL